MSGWIACHSSRASWAFPWCFLPPSIWISKIAVGGKTKFSCLWATNAIFILHRFITCLENVWPLRPLHNKAGQHGWCCTLHWWLSLGAGLPDALAQPQPFPGSGQALQLTLSISGIWCCWVAAAASVALVSQVTRSCLNHGIEIPYGGS